MPAYARTVRRTDDGSAPGLLLAHGAGGGVSANYGPVLDRLAAGRRLVGADYPGTGVTPRATVPLELDELAEGLVAAADAEGLERFAVAGYSLGGAVAVRIAARHPERVTALVLTAPFARPDHRLRLTAQVWRDLAADGRPEVLGRFMVPLAAAPEALAGLSAEEVEEIARVAGETAPPGSPEHADLVARLDARGDLARITAPTLVISTTADRLVEPALHRAVAAGIPGARLAELPTGHLPFAEAPERWAELTDGFLRETEGR
ncbi:alpha/beta fold hydrolase [Streptomyces sp. LP05-1]|uniref:Alpha/beta fold hydrolase n=1 Tax=Streptomyces pyxinae TaxID=2970734 RepID=A0ABT2CK00_9ACTN|nr:alpha/beta fold hydrolase [Streptomyces sp. LP05-1]MCS0637746.1 alpha/beta fold hydrolase [Streptomyces sp. LP05-1]